MNPTATSRNPYMGAPVELSELPNGALVNAASRAMLDRSMYPTPTSDRVAPGVTVFGGDTILNLTVIEGDDGLIVYDTGETGEDGERFLAQIRSVSDKPIVAILYSHAHYVHGARQLVGDGDGVSIIGHPKLDENLRNGGAGALFPETGPLLTSRAMQQFNQHVAPSGPDGIGGGLIRFGHSGLLPVNLPVAHGQRMRIAGVDMQFFTQHGSDTDDCLTVWLPERGVVLNNLLWPYLPNVYTLRGSKFRDPREWRDGLQLIADLEPEVLVNTHARSIVGREAVRDTLEHVVDALNLILDQTLRGILRGHGPEALREFVELTPELAAHPNLTQVYGEIAHFGPYLYQNALGWFDGDAATINPVPPVESASRLVEAMGGHERVLALFGEAMQRREFAWAAQLIQYLYRLAPQDAAVRARKAEVLRALGRVTPAHTTRSWYLSHARALVGEVRIPRLQFPSLRMMGAMPPSESMDQYRVRIDPRKAGGRAMRTALRFTDRDARHGWRVRRGVATFESAPPADVDLELEVGFEAWLRFFSCRAGLDPFLAGARAVSGTIDEARRFFGLFDHYAGDRNQVFGPDPE